jgi:ketosteroid isomerase-like protein
MPRVAASRIGTAEVIDVYNKYIFFFRFENGKIAELREYYNPILASRQTI